MGGNWLKWAQTLVLTSLYFSWTRTSSRWPHRFPSVNDVLLLLNLTNQCYAVERHSARYLRVDGKHRLNCHPVSSLSMRKVRNGYCPHSWRNCLSHNEANSLFLQMNSFLFVHFVSFFRSIHFVFFCKRILLKFICCSEWMLNFKTGYFKKLNEDISSIE